MAHRRVAEILALASATHGLVRLDHLREIGVERGSRRRLLDAGVLEPFGGRGIYRVGGGEPTPHQRLLAAVWAAGPHAAASHRSAAWVWGLDPVDRLVLDVSIPSAGARRPAGVALHYRSSLPRGLVTTVDAITVTEPTLTLVDLASVLDADDLECAVDSALRQGLTSPARCRTVLHRLARRGRTGIGPFRSMVESRLGVDGVTDSAFEVRMVQVLRRGGLPEPVRQFEVRDRWGVIGRFDCAYPDAHVVVEADSVRHHHSRERFEADRARRTRAEAAGWRVPTFTWRQVTRRPTWVVAAVRDVLEASGWDWRSAVSSSSTSRG
ncbi:MAG: hypothetical protein ACXIVQ_04190 [Acidimicrobiales bacterium]